MKKKTTIERAVGKTFTGHIYTVCGDGLLLLFEDSYVYLTTSKQYEVESIVERQIELYEFDEDCLIENDFATKEELDESRRAMLEENRLFNEAQQRAEYERLRAKFEGTSKN